MSNQNLFFNILTFDFPKRAQIFYFRKEETSYCKKLYKSSFPDEIESIFPTINTDGTEFIYTTYDCQEEGFTPLEIDFRKDNPDLVKGYYNSHLYHYFKKYLKQITRLGFINECIVWLPSEVQSNQFFDYERISLKIQLCKVSNSPEIVISYDGKAKVFRKPVSVLTREVSSSKFNYVLQGQSIFKYERMVGFEDPDYDSAYTILTNELKKLLNLKMEAPLKQNPYTTYLQKIDDFYDSFINTEDFREVFPLNCNRFLKVSPARINRTSDESNDLSFSNNQKGRVPKYDVRKLKPYQKSPWSNIHLFFIVHQEDKQVAFTLKDYFEKGYKWFRGLYDFAGLLFHTESSFSIVFTDKNDPLSEIENKLDERNFNPEVKYFAIYITPFGKFEQDKEKRLIYYRLKEMLLKRNITSQAIDAKKVLDPNTDYVYSLPNIAVAILAKLDGIPWRLHTPVKNELILGVGAFKHQDGVQYIGSAFSFNNLGSFNNFDYFMRHETDLLAGCIAAKVREYASINNTPDRLIIHFYKKLSQKELDPIERALQQLELPKPIPIYIITINKTESEDTVAFDDNFKDLMPESGLYINLSDNKYLLFNNTRYSGSTHSASDGFPFPVKLAIDCTDKTKLKDIKVINELINQVYQFSRMYWKSVRQQNLPVTIKYPEMVAQIAPHFEGNDIPHFGKDNLWFL